MQIDPAGLDPLAAYKLAVSLIIPRPIAWTSSASKQGIDNLAPFSFFMGVSTRPPSIAISVARGRGGVLKDTARNILDTGEFCVSMVPFSSVEGMNHSSASFPPEVSEFEACGLTAIPCERIAVSRPREALVSMECTLVHSHDMGSTHLLVGEVGLYHVADEVLIEDDKGHRIADCARLDPVSRLGGSDYARVTDLFTLPRPPRVVPQK
jgi:flavin reductase (DIM6/NTAB) family NADH-FMN oxidoreductase RutF